MEDTERKKRERIYQDDMRHIIKTTFFWLIVALWPSTFYIIFVSDTMIGNIIILIYSALGVVVSMVYFIVLAIKAKRDRDRDLD